MTFEFAPHLPNYHAALTRGILSHSQILFINFIEHNTCTIYVSLQNLKIRPIILKRKKNIYIYFYRRILQRKKTSFIEVKYFIVYSFVINSMLNDARDVSKKCISASNSHVFFCSAETIKSPVYFATKISKRNVILWR